MDTWFDANYTARVITAEKLFIMYKKIVPVDGRRSLPTLLESFLGKIW